MSAIQSGGSLLNTFERVFNDPVSSVKKAKKLPVNNKSADLQQSAELQFYGRSGGVLNVQPGSTGSNFDQKI